MAVNDPFAVSAETESALADVPRQAMSLFELNSLVHAVLKHTLADSYWLVAEIGELRVASNGHCYLEFVQKDDQSGSLVAKARGNIWQHNYVLLSRHFERMTGQPLSAGMKVLVQVSVSFHELYGYALQVSDIDPTYTLGDLARRRQAIIRQLEEDGVLRLNKELPLPRVIGRVAIISSATAAGYGDFCNQLEQSGVPFVTRLFPAVMQGDRVESSVIAALDAIAAEAGQWDVVVIIRGGGATTDLGGFDSYLLAANVAQFPLPVLTGIGHERDDTITDMVAHTRFKTPTAVAAFLIENRSGEVTKLADLTHRLLQSAERRLQSERIRLGEVGPRLRLAVLRSLTSPRQALDALTRWYERASTSYTAHQRERLLRIHAQLRLQSHASLMKERQRLGVCASLLEHAPASLLEREQKRLAALERGVRLAGPDRILALGFTITLKEGKPVNNADQLKSGDVLTTRFAHGEVLSEVK